MRRVVVVIQTPTYGGPHNQVLRLYEPLRALGWETEALLPAEPGTGAERLLAAGITVHRAPMCRLRRTMSARQQTAQWRNAISGTRAIRSILDARTPDVVQVCGLLTLQGAYAAHLAGVPIVWQMLSTFAPTPLRAVLAPVVRRWAHTIMSTGEETARQHPGLNAKDAVSFFPPVVLSQWQHDPNARINSREALGIPDDAVLVVTVGNFNRQKCHEMLVEVARRLRASDPAAHYRLIGSPTPGQQEYYDREVVRRAEEYGLMRDGRLGFISGRGVSMLIHAADIFVLTSRAEGVPTALLEAMAAGIPAVVTDVGSVREAVSHGETGFVVPPGNASEFARSLQYLVRDSGLRARMGAAALVRARNEFASERCADRHVAAYSLALQRKTALTLPSAPEEAPFTATRVR